MDALDIRYPRGSRVVIANTPQEAKDIRVLSLGLVAAGEPVVSYDGRRVVFTGKVAPGADWQIYEARLNGGRVRRLTSVPGGAMGPALLADGSLLFISPVPKPDPTASPARASALFAQPLGGPPRQLTFSSASIFDPTVLSDGRILFVSTQPSGASNGETGRALYTINNDGTEILAFTGQHDEPRSIQRPRQLDDGRIVFLAADAPATQASTAEFVLSSRPFRSRAALLPNSRARIRSVQLAGNGHLLLCAAPEATVGDSRGAFAVFLLHSATGDLGEPLMADPEWDSNEAVPASASRRPMGRLSNLDFSRTTGQLLCLDVNDTSYVSRDNQNPPRATRVRLFTQKPVGAQSALGEVEVQADGSFMAEVPADIPIGFDALDERGQVLRHQSCSIWVRPGENRSCLGCHEPHNHSPRNFRPLAVRVPVPKLIGEPTKLAQTVR